jgi:type I restriction enzyme M protein
MPPAKSGDFAWVQHMVKSMSPRTGRMAVVLPHGALFRMAAEGRIRRKLLEMDILEAVIGLGPNLFYGAGLAACVLVFRMRKKPDRRNRMLIIDASKQFKRGRNQNTLEPAHAEHIFTLYHDHKDVPGESKVVTLDEVAANDYNLNIPLYVEPVAEEETVTVEEALANLKKAYTEACAAEDRLTVLLRKNGLMK